MELVLKGGLVFDGSGAPPVRADVGIADGRVAAIGPDLSGDRSLDCTGRWVMPGFVDLHTHYDAEVELDPHLSESLRHGVTTVMLGSCSLGASLGSPEDIADIFCRVEGVPRSVVLPLFEERKDWSTLPAYLEHLDTLELGVNVASYVGHSNLRMEVMGFQRSLDPKVSPTEEELQRMEQLLEEALDAGYVGLSVQTLPWDKLDGDRNRSQPLPSFYASWSEYRRLARVLRARDRVFQGVPNLVTKLNVGLFMLESAAIFRKPLRTTVISVMDLVDQRFIYWLVPAIARFFNRVLGADFRFQALPNLFDVWCDGMDMVIFEEFASGTEALHLVDLGQRAELLRDPAYRARFRKEWGRVLAPKVYHRDMRHTEILACPDPRLVGRSFQEIADEDGSHPVDAFLDLCAEHGPALRWYSVMANDRLKPLEYIVSHPDMLIGFSDAGAHLRTMAHYNFPLRMLNLVKTAQDRGEPFMSTERAIHRLTGEIADWYGLDAGHLEVGRRADVVVVDPAALDDRVEQAHEAPMPGFPGLDRLVRRNAGTVPWVIVGGAVAMEDGQVAAGIGKGRVLRA